MTLNSSFVGRDISDPIPQAARSKRHTGSRWDQLVTSLATTLYQWHTFTLKPSPENASTNNCDLRPIRVVCVSDTHSAEPEIPDGDILLHAGDLCDKGTFEELQTQLNWLNRQPHQYKVVIAGNHELLLDQGFLDRFPERIMERPGASREDLRWGDLIYLNDNSTVLNFFCDEKGAHKQNNGYVGGRQIKIYGSPWTHQFGNWAFQVPLIRDVWTGTVPKDTDILLMHGPPKYYLDANNLGNIYLNNELCRVKPRLTVFGHIHAGYGQESVVFDDVERTYTVFRESRWKGLILVKLAWEVLLARCKAHCAHLPLIGQLFQNDPARQTTLVNASIFPGSRRVQKRCPIVVEI